MEDNYIFKHTEPVVYKGKKYRLEIKSYSTPIKTTEAAACHTIVAFMDGNFDVGHIYLNNIVDDETAPKVAEEVIAQIHKIL